MLIRAAITVLAVLGLSGCVFYLSPQCTDLILNGDETDIDCGGTCGACNVGDRCSRSSDCDQSTCDDGRCVALPCANGVQDGQETDVDCGGSECRKCAGGRACQAAGDCFSNNCEAGTRTCFALDVLFADAVSYPSGQKTYALFTGDLDGDGDADLAAANEQESTISVFLNNGAGVFTRLERYTTGQYPTGGAITDMNGDKIADVVTADYHGNSVSVLLGTGGGVLADKATYPTVSGAETSNLAVGDLNGDGSLDVIATNPLSSSVSMFLGSADGTLADAVDIPVGVVGGSAPYSAAIGDFNGDGRNDVAVADVRSGTIIVRLGNGDGTFQTEVPYLEGGVPPYILITRDLDLDGKLDLVCANRGSDDVSVLLGRGDGAFRKTIVSSTGKETGPYSVAVADFNMDGVPDVVTANFEASTASVLLGVGDGSFEAPLSVGAMGITSYGTAAADFNRDGKPDIATANATSNDVTVKLNQSF
ncbi:MAG TPA: VCBS repeat-containing protein [Kofleriaceae bacterium]|nr:VCBS repeat-containing protein [Kofleriaceae bacterium]